MKELFIAAQLVATPVSEENNTIHNIDVQSLPSVNFTGESEFRRDDDNIARIIEHRQLELGGHLLEYNDLERLTVFFNAGADDDFRFGPFIGRDARGVHNEYKMDMRGVTGYDDDEVGLGAIFEFRREF